DERGEQGRLPALPRAHRARIHDRYEQPRHSRVARDVRRHAPRSERRRSLQECRVRLRHRRRVVPAEAQAETREQRSPTDESGSETPRPPSITTALTTLPEGRVENPIDAVAHTVASSASVVPNCSSGPMLCKTGGPMRLQTGTEAKRPG